MKILIITDAAPPQINGVVRTYESLRHELELLGHCVNFVTPKDCAITLPLLGYPEIRLGLFPSRMITAKIKGFSPDHIHIATEGPLGWAARALCRKDKRPFTTAYHSHFPAFVACRLPSFLKIEPFLYKLLARFHAPAHKVFVINASLATHLRAKGFRDNFAFMTRGMDTDIFTPDGERLFDDLPRPIALYVGRISREKTIDAFLSADWSGSKIVVGDGPERADLERRFPTAHFLGYKTGHDLAACYRSADIFVFPSKTDTFGLVMIEALACGCPIAAYPVMGPQDIVTDIRLGTLHHNISHAMANAVSLQKTTAFRHFHAKTTYTWGKAAKDFLSALPNYG